MYFIYLANRLLGNVKFVCHYFHCTFSVLCHANLMNEWYKWLGTEKGKKITI